ncbi:unnamed protein product [Cladocopium goreaui]|uniref:Uncharacterized protein n=1 Tax=Cladocopium goreaui TaxID=2562237 RepID=A0A9P1GS96_9DINO|nr:unnamed protein product [Cladocopium goreaui]
MKGRRFPSCWRKLSGWLVQLWKWPGALLPIMAAAINTASVRPVRIQRKSVFRKLRWSLWAKINGSNLATAMMLHNASP